MEEYVSQIIGKTISSVIIRERKSCNPRCQLLISFEEGGHFEFYCPDEMIKSAKGCGQMIPLKSLLVMELKSCVLGTWPGKWGR